MSISEVSKKRNLFDIFSDTLRIVALSLTVNRKGVPVVVRDRGHLVIPDGILGSINLLSGTAQVKVDNFSGASTVNTVKIKDLT